MIIEKQTFKSKSELQAAIQKARMGKAIIYYSVGKKEIQKVFSAVQSSKSLTVIVIEP